MTEKIKVLIDKRLKEQSEIRESLGTGFPIEEDAKLRRLAALELVLDDLKSLLFENNPLFAVGEYYFGGNVIYKVLEIEEYVDRKDIELTVLYLNGGSVNEDKMYMDYPFDDTPATAEQIATFKRAEHFASKGRKLDEFRDRDIVKYEGELFFAKTTSESNLISVSGFDGYGWEDMNADEFELIQTAEELQEVENNE